MCSDVAVILVARAASGATGRANVGVDDDTGNNEERSSMRVIGAGKT